VRFWKRLELACLRTVRTKQPTEFQTRYARFIFALEHGTLFIELPSGRRLAYPEARIGPGKFTDTSQVYFKDNAHGGWKEIRGWYGTFTENVVQALSRDLLAAAMQRLDAAGYGVVLHVHDEIVCEVPEGFGSTEEFHRLLTQVPTRAAGLPIAAKVWTGRRYVKTKSEPSTPILVNGAKLPLPAALTPVIARTAIADNSEDEDGWADIPLADVIGELLIDGKICCPFHEDHTPSLFVYTGHYHCYVCGAHGNHLDWLTEVEGMAAREAEDLLAAWDGPRIATGIRNDADEKAARQALALKLWAEARPITNTLAARYLANTRGVDLTALPDRIDDVLRFHPRCPFGHGTYHPCLMALMRNVATDSPTGIQRIALTTSAKKIDRRMLGQSGVVKLWPANSQLVIGEGLETVLAAATRIPYDDAPLRPAWAALSSDALTNFPIVSGVERLIILVDHDSAGKTAASFCTGRWNRAGRTVIMLTPTRAGEDFNDIALAEK
jgi:Toprim domain/CHC2 zinc finger